MTSTFTLNMYLIHLRKPRALTPLRSLRVRNEVELVPLACERWYLIMLYPSVKFESRTHVYWVRGLNGIGEKVIDWKLKE